MNYEFKGDTPPWRIASSNKKNQFYVIHGKDLTGDKPRELQVLCINYGFHPIKEQLDKTQANAHLIAAAPDLLEACVSFVKAFEDGGNIDRDVYNEAKATIHKALNIQ